MAMYKTQLLVEAFKSAKGNYLSKEEIASLMGIDAVSVAPYVCELKQRHRCDFAQRRNGRVVEGWVLTNPTKALSLRANQTAKGSKSAPVVAKKVAKPVKAAKTKSVVRSVPKANAFDIPTLDRDLDITEVTDRELDDLKAQLGL
jgi:biotin operon repressor